MNYNDFDYIVVGSGFAGSVIAERAANSGKNVLVIEKRNVVGGNMFDYFDNETQTYIQEYGPHIFRTDSESIWNYLSQFTRWIPYHHKVRSVVNGLYIPVPINLKSIQMLCNLDPKEFLAIIQNYYPDKDQLTIHELAHINNAVIKKAYDTIYENIYLNFSIKQWGRSPDQLDFKTITARIPIRLTNYDGYFNHEKYGLPEKGYSTLFKRMLSHSRIRVLTSVNAKNVMSIHDKNVFFNKVLYTGKLIYTGCIDELFDYSFGHLPYRAVTFKKIRKPVEYYQPVATLNYPNTFTFTRSTEFKHFTKTKGIPTTVIMREYPKDFEGLSNEEPIYPIPSIYAQKIYQKYKRLSSQIPNLHLFGRLGEYKYYSMDEIIGKCLHYSNELIDRNRD